MTSLAGGFMHAPLSIHPGIHPGDVATGRDEDGTLPVRAHQLLARVEDLNPGEVDRRIGAVFGTPLNLRFGELRRILRAIDNGKAVLEEAHSDR